MSLTLSPGQVSSNADSDLGVEFGTQKPTGLVRQALPLKRSEHENGINSFSFTPPQAYRLDDKSPLAVPGTSPTHRHEGDAAAGQQASVTHAAMVSQLADVSVPTWAQAAQAAPSASASSSSMPSGRANVPEVPLWSAGAPNGATVAPLPAAPQSGNGNLNKRRIFLRYIQGDSPQIDLANLTGGQGNPVIIQVVTPGGRAEQNGVKAGAVIRSINASTTFKAFPAWQVRAMLHAPVTVEVEQDMVLSPASPRCKEIRLTRKSELKLGIAPRNGAWSHKDNVLLAEEVVFKPRTAPLWISSHRRDLPGSVPEGRILVDTIDLPSGPSAGPGPVIYELRRPEAHRLVDNAVRTAWATVSKEADHVARVPRGSRARSHSPFCGLEECLPQCPRLTAWVTSGEIGELPRKCSCSPAGWWSDDAEPQLRRYVAVARPRRQSNNAIGNDSCSKKSHNKIDESGHSSNNLIAVSLKHHDIIAADQKMSEVGSAEFRFEDVLLKLAEAEGSDCHFEDMVPDLPTSYDAAVSAFRDAKTAAEEAFELAVNPARKRKDLAKSRHESELAAMEMQLARCCDAFSANPREFSGTAGVSHVPSAASSGLGCSSADTIHKASPPDLKELKACECKYDSSLKEYKAACRAVLTARELAQKHYDEAMAIAAHELRQAWFPPRYSQATTYSDNFQKLVLERTYSREDVRAALGGIWGYSEVQDIDFGGDLSAFQASLAKAWSRGPLCHDVNRCLYQDDAKQMELLAPYIQHFREAFRGSHPSCRGVLRPFDGLLFRYMHLQEGELDKYQQDCSIVWPTFSSCTYDEAWLKSSLLGDSAEFEIRSYGAAEASASKELYLPCLIEEHVLSRYVYQKEVVMPPFCSFRVVNVNKTTASFWTGKPRRTRVFLETTQFPSVWQSIAAGQADEFAKWARKNEGLVSMSGNDVSIVNEIAKAAAKAVEQSADETVERLGAAHDMFRACAEMGAPLSEVDPETGSTAVFTIAESLVGLKSPTAESLVGLKSPTEAVKESLKSMIKGMARSGANVTIPHKGRRLNELLPDLAKELEKETLLGSKWQYWVDDGIHGKSDGWYDYDAQAWQAVSRAYDDWLRDGSVPAMTVKSGWYTYKVSFGEMMQENISTRKRRNIRRMVVESSSGSSAASAEAKCTIS
ncbi:unnamed protein product [Symbiodinium sp. CCMP2592]|nr:unnamed protein product [Symbiodinium sp. CCMP2592]